MMLGKKSIAYKKISANIVPFSAAIRIIADELSYTIFMPNTDVRVVDTRVLYELANELEDTL